MSVAHNNYETLEFLEKVFRSGRELFVRKIFISEIKFIKPGGEIVICERIPIKFRKKICDTHKYDKYLSTHYFPVITNRDGNTVGIILDAIPDEMLKIAVDPSYTESLFVDGKGLSLR